MKKQLTDHDLQALSEFLDGKLSPAEKSRLKNRLSKDADLREALEGLRRTRIILRNSPKIRAPRNYTLTRQMAGVRERPGSGFVYPFLKYGTVLASILFIFTLIGDFVINQPVPMTPLLAQEMAPAAVPVEELAAESVEVMTTENEEEFTVQQEMAVEYPTMTPAPIDAIPTEVAIEKSAALSNAPMEPMPSTIPSMLTMETTADGEEAPMLAPEPEEQETQTGDAAPGASVGEEMETGAGAPSTDMEVMADQAADSDSILADSPASTTVMGYGERSKIEEPQTAKMQTGINIWRLFEIIFGCLIIILGLSAFIYRIKKKT